MTIPRTDIESTIVNRLAKLRGEYRHSTTPALEIKPLTPAVKTLLDTCAAAFDCSYDNTAPRMLWASLLDEQLFDNINDILPNYHKIDTENARPGDIIVITCRTPKQEHIMNVVTSVTRYHELIPTPECLPYTGAGPIEPWYGCQVTLTCGPRFRTHISWGYMSGGIRLDDPSPYVCEVWSRYPDNTPIT